MRIVQWTAILLLFCLCDARLDFWNGKESTHNHNKVNDLNPNKFSPVIFIPGCGGNKLQARLNKAIVPHFFCWKNNDYFDVWLDPTQMVPLEIDCWVDNMKLSYDNVTRKTRNTPGVEFKLPEFGRTEDLEWVDTTPIVDRYDYGAYYYSIAHALVDRGYARGYTLFGAPYDFRRGPNENKDWFLRLKELVEYSYKMNDNIGVTFIAHSMGGRMLLHFLQQMPQEWKDQYVKQMITLSTPWGGSIQAIQAISVGYDFGANVIQNIKMKQVQETCPSVVWLMPSKHFWKQDEVMVTMNKKNYTLQNIDQFFYDIGLKNAVEMRKDLEPFDDFTAPGVEVHCLYGENVGDTVERLDFGAAYNQYPTIILGNGDGTVNRRSLIGCGHWENSDSQGEHKIYQHAYPNVEHYNLLSDAGPINYILSKLTGDHDYPRSTERPSSNMMKIRLF
ncbi:group XV phospholipase A2-like isoform X2 [Contarinia nasturtii]|uniref:group XV phospholipase A2-like isoform X2 n=1 Tax=Contarinia nasturtii TaxID=265458 RepID=UPI0012D4871A|nr:group XV phospholipase A2-like isoform X2 [Contarinia nasturtii]